MSVSGYSKKRITKQKPTKASVSCHPPSSTALHMVLMREESRLRRVSRSQYCLAGVCALLCIAAVFTDGVSDGYPTRDTLWHFFCLGALYVALHTALVLGMQQQGYLIVLQKGSLAPMLLDPIMVYLPLCMAVCPHLCSSVLHFGRDVDTKLPVDDMMLTVIGLGILCTWYFHRVAIPQRWYMWGIMLAVKSALWACEYIVPDSIDVGSSSLQYQLVRLGFPHGNTLYLLSGAVRYCIASRFMVHGGVHRWSRYTSIVVCLFLLTYPHFIHPDLTVRSTPAPRMRAHNNVCQMDTLLHTRVENVCQPQQVPDGYCNMTTVDSVISTFRGVNYIANGTKFCRIKVPDQCTCKAAAICRTVQYSQSNAGCIEVSYPNGATGALFAT